MSVELHPFQTDVAVVGGGVAGLTAAIYLARAGARVALFEKAPELGGRSASADTAGYLFNRGIHALYTGGAASQVLQELGVAYSGNSPKGVFVLDRSRLYPLPADPLSLLSSPLLSLADKLELLRVLATLPKLDAHRWRTESVQAWIDRSAKRPRVRQFLASQAVPLVYTSALDLVSAEVLIDKLQRLLKHPVVYIDGGWQTLVDGLRQKAEAAGVRVMAGARVEAVQHHKDRVEGIRRRGGTRVGVGAVILAASPKEAAELMEESGLPALPEITDALLPARVASLAVALGRLPDPRHAVVQDLTRPLFMSVQSLFSRVAPPGGALVYAFKPLDPRTPSDPEADEKELESLLDAAQPGWREVTLKRQYLPRIAAVGALPTASTGGFAGRPGVRVAGLENLFLAGDWVGPEGFLADASFASARQAAQLAAQAAESRKVGTRSSD